LGSLEAEVDRESLDDGAGNGAGAGVGADDDADEAVDEPEHDAQLGHEAVDDGFGVEGPEQHGGDADEGEQADGQRRVAVWRRGEQEGQRGPEAGEDRGGAEAHETGLHEHGVSQHHLEDAEQDVCVADALRVGAGVVGHEEVEQQQDEILHAEREPVDAAPAGVLGQDAGKEPRDQHPEQQTGYDDGERGGTTMGWCEIADEGEHELRRDGCDGGDEREGEEDGE